MLHRLEEMDRKDELDRGSEVFVFTDNHVAKRAFYKGTSKSRGLFELIVRFKKLEMHGRFSSTLFGWWGNR
jgi:hypothetical protein